MADIRQLVTIDQAGTVTTVANLENGSTYIAVKNSFEVKPPEPQTQFAESTHRYRGAFPVSEWHKNGEVAWQVLVKGATHDQCLQNADQLVAQIQPLAWPGLHLEWRPDGATYSTYFEVRGPGRWKHSYRWDQFKGASSIIVDITVPVAPLAKGAYGTLSVSAFTVPNVVQLSSAITGTAPATADITISKASGAAGPAFGLLAWWNRQGTPPGSYSRLFGILEAESGGSLTTWSSGADAGARGGNRLAATASGAGTATAVYKLSANDVQSALKAATVDVEVWARVYLPSTIISPRLNAQFAVDGGSGATISPREFGTTGRPLTVPASSGYRLTRVGTLTLPLLVDTRWAMTVTMSWAAGSSGTVGLDWLVVLPADQRACSPTYEPLDSSYPRFMPTATGAASKTITSALAGSITASSITAPDTGLGGTPLELPPGDIDMFVLMSEAVPDEVPAATAAGTGYTNTTLSLGITPRFHLARGA